jgi:hypothetical protein
MASSEWSPRFIGTPGSESATRPFAATRPAAPLELAPPSLDLRSQPKLDATPSKIDCRLRHVVVSVLVDAHCVVMGKSK